MKELRAREVAVATSENSNEGEKSKDSMVRSRKPNDSELLTR